MPVGEYLVCFDFSDVNISICFVCVVDIGWNQTNNLHISIISVRRTRQVLAGFKDRVGISRVSDRLSNPTLLLPENS